MAFAGDASAMTGDRLQTLCSYIRIVADTRLTYEQWGDLNECFGYIAGATAGMLHGFQHFCLPEKGFTNGIMTKVVLAYLDKHPERLHINAAYLVDEAFAQAYPCQGK